MQGENVMKAKNIVYKLLSILFIVIFTFAVIKTNVAEPVETTSAENLSNTKIGWGIRRNDRNIFIYGSFNQQYFRSKRIYSIDNIIIIFY